MSKSFSSSSCGITSLFQLLLVFCCLHISTNVFSQTETTEFKSKLGVYFSPEIGYRLVLEKKPILDSMEAPSFVYSAGIAFERKLSKRVHFQTGIGYTIRGMQSINYGYGPDYDYPPISSLNPWTETNIYYWKYHYVGVPLHFKFELIQGKKFNSFISTGLDLNYLIKAQEIQWVKYQEVFETRYINDIKQYQQSFDISYYFSLGAEYDLGKRFTIRLEPNFKLSLLGPKQSKTTKYDQLLYNAGLNVSTFFKL